MAFLNFLPLRHLFRIRGLSRGGPNISNLIPNPPPSKPSSKKQEQRKPTKMSRQNRPRRRVITDSDDEIGQTTKLFRYFSQKHHPHTALLIRYVVCFLLGGLIGLIPYLVFVIELCKANLEVRNPNLPSINGYQKTKDAPKTEVITSHTGQDGGSLTSTSDIDMNFTKPFTSTKGPTTPQPTRIVKSEKKAEGTGNDDISLQCRGTMHVIRVRAFGIPGDNKTVHDFDKHCQANLAEVDGTNVCIVSLKRVYKTSYPPFIKTLVTYSCSYNEYIS